MALMNFSLPFSGSVAPSNWITTANPIQHHAATAVNDLLYSPEGHQAVDSAPNGRQIYKNDPYSPPTQPLQQPQQQQQQPQYQHQTYHYRSRATANNYLPPPLPNFNRDRSSLKSQHIPQLQPPLETNGPQTRTVTNYQSHHTTRAYGESRYEAHEFFNENISSSFNNSDVDSQSPVYDTIVATPHPPHAANQHLTMNTDDKMQPFPANRPTYTQVQAGHGTKTQVHAVLDYDNDDYYDDENGDPKDPSLTPIQGPIFIKNGSVPVVPLLSYPTMNNGTFIRIPIWWTALSVALGLEVRGEVIKGTPCVKRNNQLFCPTAGNSYPLERIEEFIDENKALMRRMYGDFRSTQFREPPIPTRRKRDANYYDNLPGIPDITAPFNQKLNLYSDDELVTGGDSFFAHIRQKRQAKLNKANQRDSSSSRPNGPSANPNPSTESTSGRVDACESKIEIVTPYWASNSAGKIRAIVNTQHFEQAIHQEVCTKMNTSRCGGDCGCEQKYKWHRLLAYDPDNDCKGIFMDWFLFPSCCVCRCNP